MTNALTSGNFTTIDLETTGPSPNTCEIIEIGAVKFRAFEPCEVYGTLIRPGSHIPSNIVMLTGISDDMVKCSPRIEDITDDFCSFVGIDDIVGHNINFDLHFLCANGINLRDGEREIHDTMSIARKKLKRGVDIENHRLCTLCERYRIDIKNAHRASDDAMATGILFKALLKEK